MDARLLSCAHCGASNPAEAGWCGQCYSLFDAPAAVDEAVLDVAAEVLAAVSAPTPDLAPGEWSCRLCDAPNAVEDSVCASCGVSIFESIAPSSEDAPVADDVLRRGAWFPGLGYGLVGQSAVGLVVALLAVAAGVTGLSMALSGAPAGILLVAVCIGIWAVSALDAYRMAHGAPMIMTPRALSLVGGVVVLVILATVAQAFTTVNNR
jgi:ribosomal protein L40E